MVYNMFMNKTTLELVSVNIAEEISKYADVLIKTKDRRLVRLVGTLEAAYNHCIASIAGDGDIFCLLKHIAYAIILAGEVDGDAASLYQIMAVITDEKIQPCAACRLEETKKGEEDGTVRNRPIEMAE